MEICMKYFTEHKLFMGEGEVTILRKKISAQLVERLQLS